MAVLALKLLAHVHVINYSSRLPGRRRFLLQIWDTDYIRVTFNCSEYAYIYNPHIFVTLISQIKLVKETSEEILKLRQKIPK